MNKHIFLMLSFLSGFIELGSLVLGYKLGYSIIQIVGLGLAYQLGNLVPHPIQISKVVRLAVVLLSIFCSAGLLISGGHYGLLFLTLVLSAIAIQDMRSYAKSDVSTALKRSIRVVGFISSSFLNIPILVVITLFFIPLAIFYRKKNESLKLLRPRINFLHLIMIVHQCHYFSYCYFLVFTLMQHEIVGITPLVGLLFTIGWITYISVPSLVKGKAYKLYALLGHLILVPLLLLLAYLENLGAVVLVWGLTGFGAGTVYCFHKLSFALSLNDDDMVFSENIGHILGVILGLLIYASTQSYSNVLLLSACLAGATATLLIPFKLGTAEHQMGRVENV